MLNKVKGGLLASFLLYISFTSHASIQNQASVETLALEKQLYLHKTWSALLHAVDGASPIKDPGFILSSDDFSLKNELVATIQALEENKEISCRFPARRLFIISALNIHPERLPKANCIEYLTFQAKAPANKISIIYASENLSQPSSMMGHVMLKMSGQNDTGINVEHGISYFTELNSFNVPKIIWDSLVTGKEGYFQISPFQEKLDYYLNKEQRNVWEYQVNFTPKQSELFHAHLWELKGTEFKYFFNSYNCATFTKMLLRVGNADRINMDDSWLSPIDVVKSAKSSGIIQSTKISPSNKWKIRMLSSALDANTVNSVAAFIDSGEKINIADLSDQDYYLTAQLADTYNRYSVQNGKYDFERWKKTNKSIGEFNSNRQHEYLLDLSDYKSPLKTPDDSQISLGHKHFNQQNWLNFKYLPASHAIEDDNRQFFSENELKLMEFSLLANEESGAIKLNSWTLYSARSNVPWDSLTGGTSGHFTVGAQQHWNDQLQPSLAANINGGIGYTYALSKDFNVYAMFNSGVGASSVGGYVYAEPEVGFYLYEILNMKTFASYKQIHNQQKSDKTQNLVSITQSFWPVKKWSIYADYQKRWNSISSHEEYGLHLKYQY